MSTESLGCPSESTLVAFAEGLLDGEARSKLERHLDGCDACRELVAIVGAPSASLAPQGHDAASASLEPGAVIGRYVLNRRIGEGGMGVVFSALDPVLERTVALKVAHAHLVANSGSRQRMLREARALARLSNPHIVPVFDVGECDAGIYLVMEFVDGVPLGTWVEGRSWRAVVARFIECARGLHAAHNEGIVHRDFKPTNALVGTDERARVLDFGLVGAFDAAPSPTGSEAPTSDRLTRAGSVLGTPAFMSPEQAAGEAVSAASDQFSFFVTLHQALYGRRPVDPDSPLQAAADRVQPTPKGMPSSIGAVIRTGLDEHPEQRHPSMGHVVHELEALMRHRRGWVVPAIVGGSVAIGAVGLAMSEDDPCDGVGQPLHGVYDGQTRQRVLGRVGRAKTLSAGETVERVDTRLSKFVTEWVSSRRELCRSDASLDQMGARRTCLESQRAEFLAVLSVLEEPTTEVQHAVVIASGLPRPQHCVDPSMPPQSLDRPEAAMVRGEARALATELARATALYRGYQFEEAKELLDRIWPRVQALGHPPIVAKTLYWTAAVEGQVGTDALERQLAEDAYAYAVTHDLDTAAGEAANKLIQSYGFDARDFDTANHWARNAEALADRTGFPMQRARFLSARGELRVHESKFDEGDRDVREALELYRLDSPGGPSGLVARSYGQLGASALFRRSFAEARDAYEQQLDELLRFLGTSHPALAVPLLGLAQVAVAEGDLEEAEGLLDYRDAVLERVTKRTQRRELSSLRVRSDIASARRDLDLALELAQRSVALLRARDDVAEQALSNQLTILGNVYTERGESRLALEQHQAALGLCDAAAQREPICAGFSLHNIAEAESALGHYAQALQHYREALDLLEQGYGDDSVVITYPLTGMGKAKLAAGDVDGAEEDLERALKILQGGKDSRQHAEAAFALARALWASGRAQSERRAMDLAATSERLYAGLSGAEMQLQAVGRWLETR